MPGRKPREAVEDFLGPIREAVTCVIPQAYLRPRSGYDPNDNPHAWIINNGDPIALGRSGIFLSLHQTYDIVRAKGLLGRWKVSTQSYVYSLRDVQGEVIAYHYHPDTVSFCHAHLRRAPQCAKLHFPTGRVSVEEVVALAIRDFGVPSCRDDYRDVLQRGFDKFAAWRTWHTTRII